MADRGAASEFAAPGSPPRLDEVPRWWHCAASFCTYSGAENISKKTL